MLIASGDRPARSRLSAQAKPVVKIVRKQREESALDLDRSLIVVNGKAIPRLDGQPVLTRKLARQLEGLRGFFFRFLVVTQIGPRFGQRGMGQRVLGIRCNGFLKEIPCRQCVENAQRCA